MSHKEVFDFIRKLNEGLDLAEHEMLRDKAIHSKDVVISSGEQEVIHVPARELMDTYYEKKDKHEFNTDSIIKKIALKLFK